MSIMYTKQLQSCRLTNVHSCALLLSNGAVYQFGGKVPQFLDDGSTTTELSIPEKLGPLGSHRIIQMCLGNAHSIFLTDKNVVLTTGSNQFGQLGLPPGVLQDTIEMLQMDLYNIGDRVIKQIDTGIAGGTCILTTDGCVFTAGELCGRAVSEMSPMWAVIQIPRDAFAYEDVVFVSHGGCMAIYITITGAVYVSGYNDNNEGKGMLGLGSSEFSELCRTETPVKIQTLWDMGVRVRSGSAGRLSVIVVDENGCAYGWGCNTSGQLGLGMLPHVFLPTLIPLSCSEENDHLQERVVQVSCGWSHSLLLCASGKVFSFGRNDTGQLGRHTNDDYATSNKNNVPVGTQCWYDGKQCMHAEAGLVDVCAMNKLRDHVGRVAYIAQTRVAAVYAGGDHSLFVLKESNGSSHTSSSADTPIAGWTDESVQRVMFSACGSARKSALGSWLGVREIRSTVMHQQNVTIPARCLPLALTLSDALSPPSKNPFVAQHATNSRRERLVASLNASVKRKSCSAGPIDFGRRIRRVVVVDDEEASTGDDVDDEEENSSDHSGDTIDSDEQIDEEYGSDDDDWGDGEITVSIDFSAAGMDLQRGFTGVADLIKREVVILREKECNQSNASRREIRVQLIFSNLYDLNDVMPLVAGMRDLRTMNSLGAMDQTRDSSSPAMKLVGVTFVSCNLQFSDISNINDFCASFALYPTLQKFALDSTGCYLEGSASVGEYREEDDILMGQLASALVQHIVKLDSLQLEGLGDTAMAALCNAMHVKYAVQDPPHIASCGYATQPKQPLHLTVLHGHFGTVIFQKLSDLMCAYDCIMALSFPEHSINDDMLIALLPGVTQSTSLRELDLHVTELGHIGVLQPGVVALVAALESQPDSVLCKVDISSDDGVPEIPQALQRRLTKCLVRNSRMAGIKMGKNGPYHMKYARMPVYANHEVNG